MMLRKSLQYAKFLEKERPIVLQIFGSNPKQMAQAAKVLVEKFKPDGIDINMGCPAKKVVKTGAGVALMDNGKLACEIVGSVRGSIDKTCRGGPMCPPRTPQKGRAHGPAPTPALSVKTRLGSSENNILKLAPKLVEAGADALIIHGRMHKDFFRGSVDYETISKVVKSVDVPVIANGGITNPKEARNVFEQTKAAAIIIGQAAMGNPFIFRQIENSEYKPDWEEIKQLMILHTELQIAYRQNEELAIREMRKHYAWYVKGFKNAAKWRQKLVRVNSLDEARNTLNLFHIDR